MQRHNPITLGAYKTTYTIQITKKYLSLYMRWAYHPTILSYYNTEMSLICWQHIYIINTMEINVTRNTAGQRGRELKKAPKTTRPPDKIKRLCIILHHKIIKKFFFISNLRNYSHKDYTKVRHSLVISEDYYSHRDYIKLISQIDVISSNWLDLLYNKGTF